MKPTRETYAELQQAYDFLNTELFEGRLPETLITLQRQHATYGYFSANQFVNMVENGETTHEIALNPIYFVIRSIPETLSVLAREMVTLDLLVNSTSTPPRRRYRNKEWADACEAIGLMPSDTGRPGGKRTGDSVETYIIEGGVFDLVTSRLLDTAFKLSWVDRYPPQMPDDDIQPFALEELAVNTTHALAPAEGAQSSLENLIERSSEESEESEEGEEGSDHSGDGAAENKPPLDPKKNAFAPEHNDPSAANGKEAEAPKMKVFAHAQADQLAHFGIEQRPVSKNLSKSKFQCPHKPCKGNAWGRPALRFWCEGTVDKPHELMQMKLIGTGKAADEQPDDDEPVVH
ncbi:hypothetical protein HX878_29580 [Pseudomonas veronii]|uniref:hypothetical protein n=1 Tax=Pseudomonas veronii TaxID=76761 RepID=UPI0015A1D815|nr:hypothetical protein [Pseudomonas veronii]NWD58861.1 hypothetical protein [Pseudomonas veronii]